MIATESENAPRYVAIDPALILERYEKDFQRTLGALKKQLRDIHHDPEAFNQYLWQVSERAQILDKIREIADSSRKMIHLSIWKEELQEVEEAFRAASSRGVKMAIVLYGSHPIDFGVVYRHSLEALVLREVGERRFALTADDRVVLLGHFNDAGDVFATWTFNRGMVNLAKDYITHDIIALKLVNQFAGQMNAAFGLNLDKLRDVLCKDIHPARAGE